LDINFSLKAPANVTIVVISIMEIAIIFELCHANLYLDHFVVVLVVCIVNKQLKKIIYEMNK